MKLSGVHKHISNILSNPRVLGPAVFVAIGASKTVKDYKKAEPEYKTNVLLRDSSILAGSLAAFTVVNPLTRMFCNTEFIGSMVKWLQRIVSKHNKNLADNNALKATKNIMQKTERVCKEAISGTINTFAGIAGAVVSNELMDKFVFSRPPFLVEQKDTKYTLPSEIPGFIQPVNQIFEKFNVPPYPYAQDAANRVFSSVVGLADIKALEKPMIALTGFSVADTKGYHNKLKKTTYELLANVLIPTIFVSATGLFVHYNKSLVKYPALFLALVGGSYAGEFVARSFKDKIYKTIDGMNFNFDNVKKC